MKVLGKNSVGNTVAIVFPQGWWNYLLINNWSRSSPESREPYNNNKQSWDFIIYKKKRTAKSMRWAAYNALYAGKVQRLHVNNNGAISWLVKGRVRRCNTCCHLLGKWKCRKSFSALAKWSPLLRPVSHFYIACTPFPATTTTKTTMLPAEILMHSICCQTNQRQTNAFGLMVAVD